MLESRMNQVSDQFSRDYNEKAVVTSLSSHYTNETYLNDTGIPQFKNMVHIEYPLGGEIQKIDARIQRNYNVDPRIFELERNAEEAYTQWKREQERIQEENQRERAIHSSLERVKAEREQLQETIRKQEKQYQDQMNASAQFNKTWKNADYYRNQEAEREEYLRQTNKFGKTVKFREDLEEVYSNNSRVAKPYKSQNDDFNFHQAEIKPTMFLPTKNSYNKKGDVLETAIDVERLEAASKHCAACEKKYKQMLNIINPYKERQRITDETIRKILIQLKGLFLNRKYQEAQDLVENSLEDGYKHADLYYMGGEIKRELKLHKEAVEYYLQALTFQVHSPFVYQSLGLTYIHLNDHKRAIPLLKHFTDHNVSDSSCFELGKCLAVAKQYLEATVYFGKAIEISPNQGYYYLHRGDSFEALGFTKLAIDDYRMFKKCIPNYQQIFESNIAILEKEKRFKEADLFKVYLKKMEL